MENFKIGEIAKIKNIDKQTLRYYEKIGLMSPEIVDENNGYRYYSMSQFIEVDNIRFCKILGLSLKEIKNFHKLETANEAIEFIKGKQEELQREMLRKQAILKKMKKVISHVEKKRNEKKIYGETIRIENREGFYGVTGNCRTVDMCCDFEKKLLEITKKYPDYSEIGHSNLYFIFNENYLYKDVQKKEELKYVDKVVIPIDEDFSENKNVERYELGRCVAMFAGKERQIDNRSIRQIKKYIEENNLKIRGDIIIDNIIDCFIVKNSNEDLYEIIVPLKD